MTFVKEYKGKASEMNFVSPKLIPDTLEMLSDPLKTIPNTLEMLSDPLKTISQHFGNAFRPLKTHFPTLWKCFPTP